jgi:perosamine synthetase
MPARKEPVGDFRYDTGAARVPWAAVGEAGRTGDVMDMLAFMMQPNPGQEADYRARLRSVRAAVSALGKVSHPATKLTLGRKVRELEKQCARLLGCKYAVFLTNATAGFEIAYRWAGIGPGDEVIIPAITFIATMSYPLAVGAKVVLADVDPATINMDPEDLARKITRRTKVIVPVHIGGYPVDMDPIMALARKHDLVVLEDAAHAFGGSYKGKMLGTIGHFGAFSFHEVKNVTSLGEGGILCTNLPFGKDFAKARFLGVDMSRRIPNWLYDVRAMEGRERPWMAPNHSATEIQAVGLLSQIKRLERIIDVRRRNAEYLNSQFKNVEGIICPPLDTKQVKSTHHLYLLQIDPDKVGGDIQTLKAKLTEKGVTNIPHFAPLYKFSVMRQLGYDTDAIAETCPNAEMVFTKRFTHLPLYPLTKSQLRFMARAVIEAVGEMKRGK